MMEDILDALFKTLDRMEMFTKIKIKKIPIYIDARIESRVPKSSSVVLISSIIIPSLFIRKNKLEMIMKRLV